ncbi:MAG: TetR/AcrR family transcriptional regulator [Alcanivorax sp.]|nr:TetR/AcrR family transcriptional regulator [Alcanivorax sp.]
MLLATDNGAQRSAMAQAEKVETAVGSVHGMDDSPRGKLLSAAARLFRDKGFDRTTVRDIAREVGIQSGSIFHHFPTKDDILFAVMVEVIRFNTARLQAACDQYPEPLARLEALIRAELKSIIGDTSEAMSVLVYEWRCLSPERQQEVLAMRAVYEQLWIDCLETLRQQGLLEDDPFVIRRLITGMASWTNTWFDEHGSLSLEALAHIIVRRVIGEPRDTGGV